MAIRSSKDAGISSFISYRIACKGGTYGAWAWIAIDSINRELLTELSVSFAFGVARKEFAGKVHKQTTHPLRFADVDLWNVF